MKKNVHPKTHLVSYKCASCGSEFNILSTYKDANVALEVCSNCHPFYTGDMSAQKIRGRAEKFVSKFAKSGQKVVKTKKVIKKSNKQAKKFISSLEDLADVKEN